MGKIYIEQNPAITALKNLYGLNLVFIDPPWNTGMYQEHDGMGYSDTFTESEFAEFSKGITVAAKQAIGNDGTFAVHCDYRTSRHWQNSAYDVGFFQAGEVCIESGLGRPSKSKWPQKHSNLLLFGLGKPYFDIEALPMVERLASKAGYQGDKRSASVLWSGFSNTDSRRTGYPTEKNPSITEIIVKALCPIDGEYADCFAGSGSSAAFDIQNRTVYLSDVSHFAVETMQKRFNAK